ncbi:MAG: hypothetical protein ACLU9S_11810 [Oscillospiraceae bacterium]
MLCGVASGSSGKTTVCTLQACCRLRVNRGLRTAAPQGAEPDYVDPMFHAALIGAKTGSLDGFFTGPQVLRYLLARESAGMDLSILEGVMGYYDGIAATSQASSYAVAAATGTPAVLVVPARRARALSAAAVVEGCCAGFSRTVTSEVI